MAIGLFCAKASRGLKNGTFAEFCKLAFAMNFPMYLICCQSAFGVCIICFPLLAFLFPKPSYFNTLSHRVLNRNLLRFQFSTVRSSLLLNDSVPTVRLAGSRFGLEVILKMGTPKYGTLRIK